MGYWNQTLCITLETIDVGNAMRVYHDNNIISKSMATTIMIMIIYVTTATLAVTVYTYISFSFDTKMKASHKNSD